MSKKTTLKDIRLDGHNANEGTERGRAFVENSIQRNGFGRSALIDKKGNVIAGNKTTEASAKVFGADVEPLIIDVDGKRPVYLRRTDLDLDDPDPNNPARRLAYEDNRSGQVGLAWDAAVMAADIAMGMDLTDLFDDGELAEILEANELGLETVDNREKGLNSGAVVRVLVYADDLTAFESAIKLTGEKNRAQALKKICEVYLEQKGQLHLPPEIGLP